MGALPRSLPGPNRSSRNLASCECRENPSCSLRRHHCSMWPPRRMRHLLRRASSCRRFSRRLRDASAGEAAMARGLRGGGRAWAGQSHLTAERGQDQTVTIAFAATGRHGGRWGIRPQSARGRLAHRGAGTGAAAQGCETSTGAHPGAGTRWEPLQCQHGAGLGSGPPHLPRTERGTAGCKGRPPFSHGLTCAPPPTPTAPAPRLPRAGQRREHRGPPRARRRRFSFKIYPPPAHRWLPPGTGPGPGGDWRGRRREPAHCRPAQRLPGAVVPALVAARRTPALEVQGLGEMEQTGLGIPPVRRPTPQPAHGCRLCNYSYFVLHL